MSEAPSEGGVSSTSGGTVSLDALFERTTRELQAVWDELGLEATERAASAAKIHQRAVDFFNEQILNEKRFCVEIRNDVRRLVERMNVMHASLGDAQTEIIDERALADGPLRPLLERTEKRYARLKKEQDKRRDVINSLLAQLAELSHKLGEESVSQPKSAAVAMEIDSESAPAAAANECPEEKSAQVATPTLLGDANTECDYSSVRERAILNDIELKLAEVEQRAFNAKLRIGEIFDLVHRIPVEEREQTPLDRQVLVDDSDAIGVTSNALAALDQRRDELLALMKSRKDEVVALKEQIAAVYVVLDTDEDKQFAFVGDRKDLSLTTVTLYKDELARLLALKERTLSSLIGRAQLAIESLWRELGTAPRVQAKFWAENFAQGEENDDNKSSSAGAGGERAVSPRARALPVSEHTLDVLVAERVRLAEQKAERDPIEALIEKRRRLLDEKDEFDDTDPDRFKIPGRLIQEEKFRKRWAHFPKLVKTLRVQLKKFEAKHACEFYYPAASTAGALTPTSTSAPVASEKPRRFLEVLDAYEEEERQIRDEMNEMKKGRREKAASSVPSSGAHASATKSPHRARSRSRRAHVVPASATTLSSAARAKRSGSQSASSASSSSSAPNYTSATVSSRSRTPKRRRLDKKDKKEEAPPEPDMVQQQPLLRSRPKTPRAASKAKKTAAPLPASAASLASSSPRSTSKAKKTAAPQPLPAASFMGGKNDDAVVPARFRRSKLEAVPRKPLSDVNNSMPSFI